MYLAIDIGGTKTLLALFSSHGLCLKCFKFKTIPDQKSYEEALNTHLQNFLPEKTRDRIRAITVAIPGVIHFEQKIYSFEFGNLNWPKIDLITPIKNLLNTPIFFVNDASLAALYEANRPNTGKGKTIYLTFSTGIGGGIVKNGKLEPSSETFEPGHVKYLYNGRLMEWEDIASAKALIEAYSSTSISDIPLDESRIKDLATRLSLGITDILVNESPETLIIGGPLAFIYKKLKKPLLDSLVNSVDITSFKLKKAYRPTESVIYGAYLYSKQHVKE
ncbi:ROK family protein [Candidatus Saccharibacteria bacterium]|nr:ROK family protein [Candidatus Saccharibacteria bacterium]